MLKQETIEHVPEQVSDIVIIASDRRFHISDIGRSLLHGFIVGIGDAKDSTVRSMPVSDDDIFAIWDACSMISARPKNQADKAIAERIIRHIERWNRN